MHATRLYQCLADVTRLRILNLLLEGPLCVCHLADILGVAQPKISRHLKALRESEALATERCYNWTICRLPEKRSRTLQANLDCLRFQRSQEPVFGDDLEKRRRVVARIAASEATGLPEQIKLLAADCC